MSMNIDRHVRAHAELFFDLMRGNREKADRTEAFYDEYFAVLDLTAEFYLETIDRIFQKAELATGDMVVRGQKVDPGKIRRTELRAAEAAQRASGAESAWQSAGYRRTKNPRIWSLHEQPHLA